MKYHTPCELALQPLSHSVTDAVAFFEGVDEDFSDGHQTAREVLSHLIFWHNAYVATAWALVTRRTPPSFPGTYCELNAQATAEFRGESMSTLCAMLTQRQNQLVRALCRLPDWSVPVQVKAGSHPVSFAQLLCDIDDHIRGHVVRLKRAAQRQEQVFASAA